jgi:hypothetical protein
MITICLIGVTVSLLPGFRANAGVAGKRLRAAAVAIAIAFLKQSYIRCLLLKFVLELLNLRYPDGTNPAGGTSGAYPGQPCRLFVLLPDEHPVKTDLWMAQFRLNRPSSSVIAICRADPKVHVRSSGPLTPLVLED